MSFDAKIIRLGLHLLSLRRLSCFILAVAYVVWHCLSTGSVKRRSLLDQCTDTQHGRLPVVRFEDSSE